MCPRINGPPHPNTLSRDPGEKGIRFHYFFRSPGTAEIGVKITASAGIDLALCYVAWSNQS